MMNHLQEPSSSKSGAELRQDSLELYLRELDRHEVLSPDEERRAAERIVELRVMYWQRLMSYGPFLQAMSSHLEQVIAGMSKAKVSAAVRRKIGALASSRSPATLRKAEHRAIEAVARAMSAMDPGNSIADSMYADIEALADGRSDGVKLKVRLPRRDSIPFANYLQDLRRVRAGLHQARRDFARGNLRLVVTMAHRYKGNGRMALGDLIQEGNVGLMTAVDRFDPSRGYRFSTYGTWWIRHAISRALSDKGRTVRLPVHVVELQTKLSRLRRDFEHKHRRSPDEAELADLAEVPLDKVRRFGRVLAEQDTPFVSDEDGVTSGIEAIADVTPAAESELDGRVVDESLLDAFDVLRPMEADILRMRFGLEGTTPKTLREIGQLYSLSRERIRQIQERALDKLRAELAAADVSTSGLND